MKYDFLYKKINPNHVIIRFESFILSALTCEITVHYLENSVQFGVNFEIIIPLKLIVHSRLQLNRPMYIHLTQQKKLPMHYLKHVLVCKQAK